MPFSRGKTRFFALSNQKNKKQNKKKQKKNQKTKKKKKKQKKKKRNKEGLGPSEVALRATSPDP